MTPEQYQTFIQVLKTSLEADARVVGLVLLGSTADESHAPDQWSDHDFFLISEVGQQAHFRQDLSWLPDADEVTFGYLETAHGLKVVYASGHVLEFAVFDMDEFQKYARVNDATVLIDRANIGHIIAEKKQTSPETLKDDRYYWGQFIAHGIIGAGRCKRGEVLSAHAFIKLYMLWDILPLLVKYVPAENKHKLDNLDSLRRFEFVYPELGAKINAILLLEPIDCARELLRLAKRELKDRMPDFPNEAFAVGRRYLEAI